MPFNVAANIDSKVGDKLFSGCHFQINEKFIFRLVNLKNEILQNLKLINFNFTKFFQKFNKIFIK